MMSGGNRLHWADIVVFTVTLLIPLGIGVVFALSGGRQRTTQEFLMGNRQLRLIPVTLSIYMSYVSAIAVLGTSAEMYEYGTQAIMNLLATSVGHLLAAFLVVPILHPLKLTSSYEYHERRFQSKALRRLLGLVLVAQMLFYTALAIFSPAIALESVTGFPIWGTVLCTGVLSTIYTTIGGLKAVVWTDSFQAIIFFAGLISVLALAVDSAGGIDTVWRVSGEGGRLIFFNMDISYNARATFWNCCVGRVITAFATSGASQVHMQRYSSLPTLRSAQVSFLLVVPLLLLEACIGLLGLAIYAYYTQTGCDPLRDGTLYSSNQLVPYFVVDVLGYPGLTGLFIAMLFGGALSTLSTNMSTVSAVLWKEVEPAFSNRKELHKALVTKVIVAVFGILAVALVFVIKILPGHVMQISNAVVGAFGGVMAGVILLGLLTPCGTWKGAMIGVVSSLVLVVWMNIGQFLANPFRETLPTVVENCTLPVNTTLAPPASNPDDVFPLYEVSFNWFILIGTGVTFVVGLISSIITGPQDTSKLKDKLVIPLCDIFCCCLPQSMRRACRYGSHRVENKEQEEQKYPENSDLGIDNKAYESNLHGDGGFKGSSRDLDLQVFHRNHMTDD